MKSLTRILTIALLLAACTQPLPPAQQSTPPSAPAAAEAPEMWTENTFEHLPALQRTPKAQGYLFYITSSKCKNCRVGDVALQHFFESHRPDLKDDLVVLDLDNSEDVERVPRMISRDGRPVCEHIIPRLVNIRSRHVLCGHPLLFDEVEKWAADPTATPIIMWKFSGGEDWNIDVGRKP